MKIPKEVNEFRRALMQALTRRLGKSLPTKQRGESIKIERVLISRPNGRLGNMLLVTPLVQEISTRFPDCKIDLFVKGNVASLVFQNYRQVDRFIKLPGKPFDNLVLYSKTWLSLRKYRYDLIINVDPNSSSGRLSSLFSKGRMKVFGEVDQTSLTIQKDGRHIAKAPVYSFREYLGIVAGANEMPVPTLSLNLSTDELAQGKEKLQQLTHNAKKTICIFTYATGSKCYPPAWWQDLYGHLQAKYSDYNIIEVLPAHNESQIDFVAPAFYSNDVREMSALIANTNVFIGADSGIMHLASAAQTTVVGLFSVSNIEKYRPYGNNSIGIDTNGSKTEWLSNMDSIISLACLRNK